MRRGDYEGWEIEKRSKWHWKFVCLPPSSSPSTAIPWISSCLLCAIPSIFQSAGMGVDYRFRCPIRWGEDINCVLAQNVFGQPLGHKLAMRRDWVDFSAHSLPKRLLWKTNGSRSEVKLKVENFAHRHRQVSTITSCTYHAGHSRARALRAGFSWS